MPLAMAQAYDVLQCFNSMALLINTNLELGNHLLSYYFKKTQNPEILRYLGRTNRCLHVLSKACLLLSKKRKQSKDVRRILYFADILALSLASSSSSKC